ncbi:MAG: hypothetical protein N2260_09045 [Syntrophobacterales bacterium]|nr:hypothetical protein [Syntrophobacterales bacterium]
MAILKKDMGVIKVDVGNLKGDNLERKIIEKAPSYFGKFLRKVKLIPIYEWLERLDDALGARGGPKTGRSP